MSVWTTATDGVVRLPDGRLVRGAGVRRRRHGVPPPDYAVYLLGRDPQISQWPNQWVRWPDFRLPNSAEGALLALREAHTRAEYEGVEIACGGGVGRTGTAIAILAILSGIKPTDAVAWVRANYHPSAVETRSQRNWIASLTLGEDGQLA